MTEKEQKIEHDRIRQIVTDNAAKFNVDVHSDDTYNLTNMAVKVAIAAFERGYEIGGSE